MKDDTTFPFQNPEILVTNETFLRAIFGEGWKTVHVTSFPDDPSNIPQNRRGICWGGHYIRGQILPPGNQYFTVSLFDLSDGKSVRQKAYLAAFYVLVIDDVGEKVPLDRVKKLPVPNYILNTSAGSQQWGWILSRPCRSFQIATNFLDGFVKLGITPDFKDPGMKGVTRYVRLPEGHNSKASRLIDGKPYKCKLVHWNPDGERYTIEQIADAFGIDLYVKRRNASTSDNADVNHPILDKIEVKQKKAPGEFMIVCPWVEGHTNQDDSGTILYTGEKESLSLGFKCHHGSCDGRTAKHVCEWVEENDPGWNARLKEWKTYIWLGVDKNFDDIKTDEPPPPPPIPRRPPPPPPPPPPQKPPPMDEILDEYLIELTKLPKDETAESCAFTILRIVKSVKRVDQLRAYKTIKEHLGWSNKYFKTILKEQQAKWFSEKKIVAPKALSPATFPNHKIYENGNIRLLDSIENTEHLLKEYGIIVEWDQIIKDTIISIPGHKNTDYANTIERVISLVRVNNLPQGNIENRIAVAAHENPVNPIVDILESLDYNGDGYVQQLADHVTVESGTEHIRDKVFRMWMILACAAADYAESTPLKEALPQFDSLMIFVGNQGLHKTQFFRAMLPKPSRSYFKNGALIDPSDKDSISTCFRYWIVEAGELDGLFRKIDIIRFKAFLSNDADEFRMPYARAARKYQRRTAFTASTNERDFLKDHTGNRRYWPLAVEKLVIPTDENIINNAWAEAWNNYINGEIWWPDEDFKKILSSHAMLFQTALSNDPIEEAIKDLIEKRIGKFAKDVVRAIDIRSLLLHRGMNEYDFEKTPSTTLIGKVMTQYDLGFTIKTKTSRYWIIRNREKYKKMRNVDIEQYYNSDKKQLF